MIPPAMINGRRYDAPVLSEAMWGAMARAPALERALAWARRWRLLAKRSRREHERLLRVLETVEGELPHNAVPYGDGYSGDTCFASCAACLVARELERAR